MKKSFFTLSLFFILSMAIQAQDRAAIEQYFTAILQGENLSSAPTGRIKRAKVEEYKEFVWQAWSRANKAFCEEKLPEISPLTNADTLRWHLPHIQEHDTVMPFYFGSKGERPEDGWPFILYLHGSGPKDSEFAIGYKLCKRFDDAPSLYFIPQIPSEKHYRWYQQSKQYVWERLLRQLLADGSVDANRIYLFGISEGGYGSQRLASFYADYLAAAGPMAGGEIIDCAPVENLGHVAFSLLTGADDYMFGRNLLTRRAGELLDSLQKLYPEEYRHNVQLIPGRGHHIDYSPTTPWMRKFARSPRPRHFIWEDFPMNGRYRNGFYNVEVHERDTAGGKERTRYEMTISDNVINVTLQHVQYIAGGREPRWEIPIRQQIKTSPVDKGRFTLYLAPDMVDFSKKVTLVVNGRRVFKGRLKPDLCHLVNSCACFFDPERLFAAAIDVNM